MENLCLMASLSDDSEVSWLVCILSAELHRESEDGMRRDTEIRGEG